MNLEDFELIKKILEIAVLGILSLKNILDLIRAKKKR